MPLVVCPTPIGNLEDVTLRVLRELAEADLVLCEDTRRTRVLLEAHGIHAPLRSYERWSEARRTAEVMPLLEEGKRVALVSDAGLPGVNDPGARLVTAAIERGLEVRVLPGPSAIETALVASGLVGERYAFVGYVPRTDAARAALWRELERWSWPVVAFESPRRLPKTLASLAAHDPERRVAVCRELTKAFEEVVRGTATELAARYAEPSRGEVTLVLGPPSAVGRPRGRAPVGEGEAVAAVAELVEAGVPRRKAARIVAKLTGIAANRLYETSL